MLFGFNIYPLITNFELPDIGEKVQYQYFNANFGCKNLFNLILKNLNLFSYRFMFCFRKDSTWPKEFAPALLVCGIDNAGKSTVVCRLCADSSDPIPTVGFVPHTVKFSHKSFRLYDVGGGERIRGIWNSYYAEVYGVIYVIDATDVRRLPETIEIFKSMCKDEYLLKKPILILANKQDTNGALNSEQITTKLSVGGENRLITECSAIHQTLDKNIKNGVAWILQYISDNYDELLSKVSSDLAAIEEQRKKERALRAERIRKAKEERQKEEDLLKQEQTNKEDSDDADMVISPFKPVKQAFVTSESNISQILSSPEPPESPEKSQKIKKKKKKRGNKVTPFHSNEGSQKSLISSDSSDTLITDNKLAPLSSKANLPKIAPTRISALDKSSLPPIKSLDKSDGEDVPQTKLSDLVDFSEPTSAENNNSVTIPGIFQNKYIEVSNVENKPSLSMNSLHTIRVDRSKFIENVAS